MNKFKFIETATLINMLFKHTNEYAMLLNYKDQTKALSSYEENIKLLQTEINDRLIAKFNASAAA